MPPAAQLSAAPASRKDEGQNSWIGVNHSVETKSQNAGIHAADACLVQASLSDGDEAESSALVQQMSSYVRVLIQGVGEDVEREGLVDTPQVRPLSRRLHFRASACLTSRGRDPSRFPPSQRVAKAFLAATLGYQNTGARSAPPPRPRQLALSRLGPVLCPSPSHSLAYSPTQSGWRRRLL